MAVRIATELADADGVELISSEPPSIVGVDTVKLGVAVEARSSRWLKQLRASVTACRPVRRLRLQTTDATLQLIIVTNPLAACE